MSRAVYAGSFDPITYGHGDIIKKASKIFDEVIVLVAHNPDKKYLFTVEERVKMIRDSLPEVKVCSLPIEETVVGYANQIGAVATIRGLRSTIDYQYELELARTNKFIQPEITTVMLLGEDNLESISSSRLKTLASLSIDISTFTYPAVVEAIKKIQTKE
jgi:pantetheine-phosphate adenylyltransferase